MEILMLDTICLAESAVSLKILFAIKIYPQDCLLHLPRLLLSGRTYSYEIVAKKFDFFV